MGTQHAQSHYVHLDMLRGISALLVLLQHARAYTITDYEDLVDPSLIDLAFYFGTSLGSPAVMVFFALSGFLVGGKSFLQIRNGEFAWQTYLLKRLTRLWIVLIPAIFLTLSLDSLGTLLSDNYGYDGLYLDRYSQGPEPPGIRTDLYVLLSNIAFLQTITVPIFGSNDPMWSLANEFWYYLIFPAALWALIGAGTRIQKLCACLGVAIVVLLLLPWELTRLGLIWVLGAIAYIALKNPRISSLYGRWYVWLPAVALAAVALIANELDVLNNVLLGTAFAISLPAFCRLPRFSRTYERVGSFLSEISYSLYLAHFPVITFLTFTLLYGQRWALFPDGWIMFATLVMAGLIAGIAMYYTFERHTGVVYRTAAARLTGGFRPGYRRKPATNRAGS